MINWDRHVGNQQPLTTLGRKVAYRCHGSPIIHRPIRADAVNWVTRGTGAATIGAISEFVVIPEPSNIIKRG